MEREKLEKAAESAMDRLGDFTQVNAASIKTAFKQGAEWLMRQPMSERMTEEEREKIKELNSLIKSMFDMLPEGHVNQRRIVKAEDMLIKIFGKEMFER